VCALRVLCFVIDLPAIGRERLAATVGAAVRGGVDQIQLRLGDAEACEWLAIADELAEACAGGARIVVNRRVDIALACHADGVYLGRGALPIGEVRALIGASPSLGASAHAPEEVGVHARAGADYVHLAPIFEPLSKPLETTALGCDAIRRAATFGIPVLAQGGIEATRVARVLSAGAAGIAVTGAIAGARDPEAAARALRSALDA